MPRFVCQLTVASAGLHVGGIVAAVVASETGASPTLTWTAISGWLLPYAAARLAASAFAAALIVAGDLNPNELLLVLYGPLSTALLLAVPRVARMWQAWVADFAITLACVLASSDWRSPFYLLWLSTLALPAVSLRLRDAAWLALAAPIAFVGAAIAGGPSPGTLEIRSTETLAIHLALPVLLVGSLAYAATALRKLTDERTERERLAIEAERRRIAWELHDSAKQRLHAAHLLTTSLQGRVPAELDATVGRAVVELESASSDMDTSLAELRSPLEGRPLQDALRARAEDLAALGSAHITVRGMAPRLPPLISAHVFRIAGEAMTNAVRHADAAQIDVTIEPTGRSLRLRVVDDGRGVPAERRAGATGLLSMENRAATIGGTLEVAPPPTGHGTVVQLEVPLTTNGRSR
jgi:signal transduction histidine kinase